MDIITNIAQGFIGWFTTGGETFTGWVTNIIPQIVCLLTFMNSIIKLVGEEKVERTAQKFTKYALLRYTIFPMLALLFLANPMGYSLGRFLDEKYKPAYFDAFAAFAHPVTGLFPHANAGELFVYMGIAQGLQQAGYELGGLAVRYFIVGLIVALFRGVITEKIYFHLTKADD
ncbi:PTS glucitol/sorbitol transporter subunit IIC [Catenisphaera adipataccumulans]|jgi:PTS system glucitol/sorbitol-specific IIC component|uniref:PTS system glucitol/sorbitol-specific IIC component n=1 Tax=Catenisphaera adipataccumulans TaxID=700500 RepID=A0A7W8CZ89_9FIRM|nr:PTS glucitol/sorbitol transporter subunit IIC [Catenisphaera adipataccumulans]MBB5183032.1 PTS system glucitol/sorbitol-specific IIC component [Catenisphaera adipataccumulans]